MNPTKSNLLISFQHKLWILLCLTSISTFSFSSRKKEPKEWYLKFDVSVTCRSIKLPGAVITVEKDGSNFETFTVGNDSRHVFKLPQDGEYLIYVSKPGYETKIVSVSTNNVPEKQVTDYFFLFKIGVDIHTLHEGIDYSILDKF